MSSNATFCLHYVKILINFAEADTKSEKHIAPFLIICSFLVYSKTKS